MECWQIRYTMRATSMEFIGMDAFQTSLRDPIRMNSMEKFLTLDLENTTSMDLSELTGHGAILSLASARSTNLWDWLKENETQMVNLFMRRTTMELRKL